jgi:hypothetical protein
MSVLVKLATPHQARERARLVPIVSNRFMVAQRQNKKK